MNKKNIFLIIFIFFSNFLFAQDINTSYFYSKNTLTDINNIIEKEFTPIDNRGSLDIKKTIVWYKIDIENKEKSKKQFFLYNDFAYMSKSIEVFELEDNIIINSKSYNLMDKKISEELQGKALVYPLMIEGKSKKSIYIKNTSLVHQLYNFELLSQKESVKKSINSNLIANLIVVVLFTLAFYNFMLFLFIKRKEFILYSLYLANCALGLFYMYGSVFHNFGIYGETAYNFNITAIFVTLFLALFIKYLFDINKNNKKLNLVLNSFIFFVLVNISIALIYDLYLAMKFVEYVYLASFVVLFYIGFYLYKGKHPLAKLFLLAYFIYIVGFFVTVMSLVGYLEFSPVNFYGSGISLVLEAFIFSYMLGYRIKLLEEKVNEQKRSLLIKRKKEQFGELISNIAHQWKQPLHKLSLNITIIEELIKEKQNNTSSLKDKINSSFEHIEYMSETVNDFVELYNPNKEKELFSISKSIEKATNLLSAKLKDIPVKLFEDEGLKINGVENEFLQILLILLNNSIDNFEDKNINNKEIKFSYKKSNNHLVVVYQDNAGGISTKNIDKIFSPYFTTKDKGSGLGLSMAKVIMEESFNGKIEVESINDLTKFTLFFIRVT